MYYAGKYGTGPRRVFQIDGIDGGILSIAERPKEDRVILIIAVGETEAQISLSEEDFGQLAELRSSLRFGRPEPQDETPVKAAA